MLRGLISDLRAKISVLATLARPSVTMANEQAEETDSLQVFEVANEYKPESGWVMLAPYGDWPNRQGMQRFQRSDADRIVANSFGGLHAKILGIPFYVGHPDHPLFEGKPGHTDTKAHGRIKQLEARADGLYANVKWGRSGKELIEDGAYHSVSVNWEMERDGSVFRPKSLKSVGLTNSPNIPVPPITSANSKDNFMERKLLAKQLGLSENATEAEIQAKLTAMANELQTAQATITALKAVEAEYNGKKTEFANAQTELTTAKGQVTTLTQQVTTLTGERDTARTNFANERKSHTNALLDGAIIEGRITAAERPALEAQFANETTFSVAMTTLAGKKAGAGLPGGKSRVDGNRQRVTEAGARQAKVVQFVNAKQKDTGMSYNDAFSAVQIEHPELFANMAQPEKE